jgi:hypothetical protein
VHLSNHNGFTFANPNFHRDRPQCIALVCKKPSATGDDHKGATPTTTTSSSSSGGAIIEDMKRAIRDMHKALMEHRIKVPALPPSLLDNQAPELQASLSMMSLMNTSAAAAAAMAPLPPVPVAQTTTDIADALKSRLAALGIPC